VPFLSEIIQLFRLKKKKEKKKNEEERRKKEKKTEKRRDFFLEPLCGCRGSATMWRAVAPPPWALFCSFWRAAVRWLFAVF